MASPPSVSELLLMQRASDDEVKLFIMLISHPKTSKKSNIFNWLDLDVLKTILHMAHEIYPVMVFASNYHSIMYSINEGYLYYGMDTAIHTANPLMDSVFSSDSNGPPVLKIQFLLDNGHHTPTHAWTQPIPRPSVDSELIPTVVCYTSRLAEWGFFEVLLLCYRSLDGEEVISITYVTFEFTEDICDEQSERVFFADDVHLTLREPAKVEFTRGLHAVLSRCDT